MARGEYVLFMDDVNYAKPYEVRTFVLAAESTRGDIFTSFVDFLWGNDAPLEEDLRSTKPWGTDPSSDEMGASVLSKRRSPAFVFLGGSATVGLFKNSFGDANSFFRLSSFRALGGYTTDRGLGYEDWELYSRAALKGYELQVVPESLYHYRFTQGSMQKSTPYSASRRRALRAYLDHLDESPLPQVAAGEL